MAKSKNNSIYKQMTEPKINSVMSDNLEDNNLEANIDIGVQTIARKLMMTAKSVNDAIVAAAGGSDTPIQSIAKIYGSAQYDFSGTQTINVGDTFNLLALSGLTLNSANSQITDLILEDGVLKFNAPKGSPAYQDIEIDVRLTGTMGDSAGALGYKVNLVKAIDNSLVTSQSTINYNLVDNAMAESQTILSSRIIGASDTFVTDGIKINLINAPAPNEATITITKASIIIKLR